MCETLECTYVFVQVEQRYELAKPHLRALASTVTPVGQKGKKTHASSLQEGGFALEDWQWALAIVSSRALTFRGERFLVPICDMFNYSPHPVMLSDFSFCRQFIGCQVKLYDKNTNAISYPSSQTHSLSLPS